MRKLALVAGVVALFSFWSCAKGGFLSGESVIGGYDSAAAREDGGAAFPGDSGEGEPSGNQDPGESGVLTAGEWNDLDHWNFWGGIMTDNCKDYHFYWELNTEHRIAISVKDGAGNPVNGAVLELIGPGSDVVWKSMTDNSGTANLWVSPFTLTGQADENLYTVKLNGQEQPGHPVISDWTAEQLSWNEYVVSSASAPAASAQVCFIVDATGSMCDEIDFLKKDLLDILQKVGQQDTGKKLFTGTVFYRDEGDDYVTRKSDFTDDWSKTHAFVKKQEADGGGDWPEAVHTALAEALTLQWSTGAYSKLAFIILDAPAHKDHQGVISSLQKSAKMYSEKGIKLIPVFCSSFSKDCEFMCRQLAILTGGTYVFLTSDSGVGEEHVEATVGDYKVEKLNDLMVRLITKYLS